MPARHISKPYLLFQPMISQLLPSLVCKYVGQEFNKFVDPAPLFTVRGLGLNKSVPVPIQKITLCWSMFFWVLIYRGHYMGDNHIKNSASADGGPRSRVCARKTLHSAPHPHQQKFSGRKVTSGREEGKRERERRKTLLIAVYPSLHH